MATPRRLSATVIQYSAHPVSAAIGLEVLRLYHEGGLLANGVARAPRFAARPRCIARASARGRFAAPRACSARSNSSSDKDSIKAQFDPALKLSERIAVAAL